MDIYDRVDLIPFDKLTALFEKSMESLEMLLCAQGQRSIALEPA